MSVVSMLCYMMGIMLCNDSRNARHALLLHLLMPSVDQETIKLQPDLKNLYDVSTFIEMISRSKK